MSVETALNPLRPAAAGLAALAFFAIGPEAVACPRWNASGEWGLQQQNWISVRLRLAQRGSAITGDASYMQRGGLPEDTYPNGDTAMRERFGRVEGQVDGDRIAFTVTWTRMVGDARQYIGRYEGRISRHGRAEGQSWLLSHPGEARLNWYVSQRFPCDTTVLETRALPPVADAVPSPSRSKAAATTSGGLAPPLGGVEARTSPAPPIAESPPPLSRARSQTSQGAGLAAAQCRAGYVWREARSGDVVCVTPQSRALVREENRTAATRVDPAGAYGPNSCLPGYVWREAIDGDVVCVTPARRAEVRDENAAGRSRVMR